MDADIRHRLPERLGGLSTLAGNLWWSWHLEARALFRTIDPELWHRSRHNPYALLAQVAPERLDALAADSGFLERLDAIVGALPREGDVAGTWFAQETANGRRPIAYFCAEFGLHNSVPIYSGGLGVLAGDHCKAASDLGVPLIGVGLCYTRGYFDQRLRLDGWQEHVDQRFDAERTPLERVHAPGGGSALANVRLADREVHIGAWHLQVGRVSVYLLDTDLEMNDPVDRALSHQLYAGGAGMRLKQEWVLGVGGVRVLRALELAPAAWHANEGHAAFMLAERLREACVAGTPWDEAVRRVRAASVFTTHTPVPAGHDVFTAADLERELGPVWERFAMTREQWFALGRHPDGGDAFHMTVAALRLSRRVSAVSAVHGQVTRTMWKSLWPDRAVDRVPIGHITNGVHLPTWMSQAIAELFARRLGADWAARVDDPAFWDRVLELDDAELWQVHTAVKGVLLEFIREEARYRWREHWDEAAQLVGAGTLLSPAPLTIGFARRFATYKRANLIFRDPERLRRMVTDPHRPVQVIFAGKANPADDPGKHVLQEVFGASRDAAYEGRIAFLEDYDLHVAHRLVEGVDLWLNLPRVPLEASGTSGMKAGLNGVPQLGTHDGWWAEGYDGTNGWVIPAAASADPAAADAEDAEALYRLLEDEVVPLFYQRDAHGVPLGWVQRMKHAMRTAGARFTARRMLQEYVRDYYVPATTDDGGGDDPPTA